MTLDPGRGPADVDADDSPDHSDALTLEAVTVIAGAVANATAPPTGLTLVQQAVLNAMCEFLLGFAIDLGSVALVGPDEFADAMLDQDPRLRVRIVQAMLIGALLLVPLPAEVMDRVQVYADALGVEDEVIRVARRLADGFREVAMIDFERSGYFDHLRERPAIKELHALKGDTDVWKRAWDEEDLYGRWSGLEALPAGSLGQGVWRFYMARGFVFPGRPESAPPVLAQHDWIHVLADYGSTVESEIEVFGLMARANHDFRGFSLLAIVLSLFETGNLAEAAGGFFQKDGGHISRDPGAYGGPPCRRNVPRQTSRPPSGCRRSSGGVRPPCRGLVQVRRPHRG